MSCCVEKIPITLNVELETHRDLVGFAPSNTNPRLRLLYRHKTGVNRSTMVAIGAPEPPKENQLRPLGDRSLKGRKLTAKAHSLPLFPGLPGVDIKIMPGNCKLCHFYTRTTIAKPSLCKGVTTLNDIYNKYSESISYRVQSKYYNHETEEEYVRAAREMLYLRNLISSVAIPKPGYKSLRLAKSESLHQSPVHARIPATPTIQQEVLRCMSPPDLNAPCATPITPDCRTNITPHSHYPSFSTSNVAVDKTTELPHVTSPPLHSTLRMNTPEYAHREVLCLDTSEPVFLTSVDVKQTKAMPTPPVLTPKSSKKSSIPKCTKYKRLKRVKVTSCPELGISFNVPKTEAEWNAELATSSYNPAPMKRKALPLINLQLPILPHHTRTAQALY